MEEITDEIGVAPLLAKYRAVGGVLDYLFLEIDQQSSSEDLHRTAALRGMEIMAERSAWGQDEKIEWDGSKLVGQALATSQSAMPTGYQHAFFDPPYTLRGSAKEQAELFTKINRYVFGPEPPRAEIFKWSTDWSNYFDAGHEWWGAFYWTIRPANASYVVVIGASSTD
jgi:hypothetical protein